MKKIISLFLAVVMVAAFVPVTVPEVDALTATAGWAADSNGVWHITSAEDLLAFGESTSSFSGKTIVLDNDIDFNEGVTLESMKASAPANVWTRPSSDFYGTFNGQGHTIRGLYNADGMGFFRNLEGATVTNLSLKDYCITGISDSGVLSRYIKGSTINGVYLSGYATGTSNFGGFCGELTTGASVFKNCWFDGTIEASGTNIGGLVGNANALNNENKFIDCLFTGTLTTVKSGADIGGIVGYTQGGMSGSLKLTRCFSIGTVKHNNGSSNGYAFCTYARCTTSENLYCDGSKFSGSGNPYGGTFSITTVSSGNYHTKASELKSLSVANSGDGWGYAINNGVVISVPACFEEFTASTADTNVHIGTPEELLAFGQTSAGFSGITVVLDNDIDLTGASGEWIQNSSSFSGTFNGQGNAIIGLTSTAGKGLFASLSGATIRNLRLVGANVTGGSNSQGLLTGSASGTCTFENVYVDGTLVAAGGYVGGFIGLLNNGTFTFSNCWYNGSVTGASYTGGFIGLMSNNCKGAVSFTDCLATGSVLCSGSNDYISAYIGGIVYAEGQSVPMTRCVATATVKRNTSDGNGYAITCCTRDVVTTNNFYCDESKYVMSGGAYNGSWGTDTVISHTNIATASSSSLASTLTAAGGSWGIKMVNGVVISVPAYFADNDLTFKLEADGKWHIRTAADLVAFGESTSNFSGQTVVLENDIIFNDLTADQMKTNAPANTYVQNASWFYGNFDGQGHSIKGLYGAPLFGNVLGCVINNLYLVEACYLSTGNGHGLIARTVYGTLFQNVYVSGYVSGGSNFGGFCGEINWGTLAIGNPTFRNCWFDGYVNGTGSNVGGFGGIASGCDKEVQFIDCLNTGTVNTSASGANVAAFIGQIDAGVSGSFNFTRCVTTATVTSASGRGLSLVTCSRDKVSVSNLYFDTSKYAMNGNIYNASWGTQTIPHTNVPVASSHTIAPALNDLGADWGYAIKNGAVISVPGYFAEEDLTFVPDENNIWHIRTVDDLVAFGESTSDFSGQTVVLDNDIVFNDLTADYMKTNGASNVWVQNAAWFQGTFNGQGHSIKGLYSDAGVGLFRDLKGARVLNLSLLEPCVVNAGSDSGIVARLVYGSLFENVYVNGYIGSSGNWVGGFCAELKWGTLAIGNPTFNNCWFDGRVDATGSAIGGFAGVIDGTDKEVTFNDCLFTGYISLTGGGNAGGIVGDVTSSGSGSVKLNRCVVLGSVKRANGSANGWAFTTTADRTVTTIDCYCDVTNCTGNPYRGTLVGGYETIAVSSSYSLTELLNLLAGEDDVWGYSLANGCIIPVPACFADEDLTFMPDEYDTWHIRTVDDLIVFGELSSDFSGQTVVLENDIVFNDLTADYMKTNGAPNVWVQNTATFSGTFNGQGHSIKGLYSDAGTGLFRNLTGATVENLYMLEPCVLSTGSGHGIVARTVRNSLLQNIYVNGYISGDYNFGGICSEIGIGGDVGGPTFKNCWFDGTVEASGSTCTNIGGFAGIASGCNAEVKFIDCLSTGTLTASKGGANIAAFLGAQYPASGGSFRFTRCVTTALVRHGDNVCGYAFSTYATNLTAQNCYVYTVRFGGNLGNASNGSVAHIDYTRMDQSGLPEIPFNLTGGDGWGWTESDGMMIAVPAYFADFTAAQMTALRAQVASITGVAANSGEDKGMGEYLFTRTSTDLAIAKTIVSGFETAGFELAYENTLLGDVYIAQLTKADGSLVTVTQLIKQNTTKVSAMMGETLSPNLGFDADKASALAGLTGNNVLYQIKLTKDDPTSNFSSGDSYVIKLKNGHFIIVDGGMDGNLDDLLDYLDTLSPSKIDGRIVIDAWFITHQHRDHSELIYDFTTDPSQIGRVYVEGFYVSEPADAVKTISSSAGIDEYTLKERTAISKLSTTAGETPVIYRPMTGQRYYFCDVTVDIIATQAMFTNAGIAYWYNKTDDPDYYTGSGNGGFNDASSWFMFSFDGKTFLDGGDSYKTGMQFIMDNYDNTDMQVDYFKVLHHGAATWNTFTNWVGTFGNLLIPCSHRDEYGGVTNSGSWYYSKFNNLKNHTTGSCYYAYEGTSAITIAAAAMTSAVDIVSEPVTTEYDVDDALDLTGMIVNVNYTVAGKAFGTLVFTDDFEGEGFTITGFDSSTSGSKTVTVAYPGATSDTFTATVVAAVAIMYGDVNNDGIVNALDLSLLTQYTAGVEGVVIIEIAADVNCDDAINALDLSILTQFTAGVEGVVLGSAA